MKLQDQSMKKWTLLINNIVRAYNVVLPAEMKEDEVIEHIIETHKNIHKWPDPETSEELNLRLISHDVKLAYVKKKKRVKCGSCENNTTKTSEVKEFTKPLFSYKLVTFYK